MAGRATRMNSQGSPNYPNCMSCSETIRTDNDNFITCGLCTRYFHRICTTINSALFAELTKEGSQIRWYCILCNTNVDDDLSKLASMSRKIISLDEGHQSVLTKLGELTAMIASPTRVNNSAAIITSAASNNASDTQSPLAQFYMEFENKERRKRNIVISNIPESNDADNKKRKEHDIQETINIMSSINLSNPCDTSNILACIRLGDKESVGKTQKKRVGPRLVKVVLNNLDLKEEIVKNARKLRDLDPKTSSYHKCFINPDRTKAELDAFFALRSMRQAKHSTPTTGQTGSVADVSSGDAEVTALLGTQ